MKRILILILFLASLLRFWDLSYAPASLYWDEMDVGYQAYSLLKTSKDYFGNPWPLYFHSFADYRAPVYIYTDIPFVAVLGLTPWSVRLPSAIFGVLCVAMIYFLVFEITGNKRTAIFASLVMTFSPWALQFSRMAFEVSEMLFFFLFGLWAFFRGLKKPNFFLASSVSFSLSMWTYSTAKLFVPLIFVVLLIVFGKELAKLKLKKIGLAIAIFLVSTMVLYYGNFFQGGGQRFSEVAIFTDPTVKYEIDQQRLNSALSWGQEAKPGLETSLINKLAYNKAIYFLDEISWSYYRAFSASFLFLVGDPILRHSPKNMGELYRIEAVTLVLGLAFLIASRIKKDKKHQFLIFWMLLAPVPSILTREGGNHATRLFFLMPVLLIIVAIGINWIYENFKGKKRILLFSYLAIWLISVGLFVHYYFGYYRWESGPDFQYGFNQAVETALKYKGSYDQVIIDDQKDSALMNYLFLTKMDPGQFQKQVPSLTQPFIPGISGNKIDNIYMLPPGVKLWWDEFEFNKLPGRTLLIASASQMDSQDPEKIKKRLEHYEKFLGTIYGLDGMPAFYIIEHNHR